MKSAAPACLVAVHDVIQRHRGMDNLTLVESDPVFLSGASSSRVAGR